MNDKQIADALVERGVVRDYGEQFTVRHQGFWTYICDSGPLRVYDHIIINDWRVAGACLERIAQDRTDRQLHMMHYSLYMIRNPRAICEAYAKSIKDGDT